MIRLTIQRKLFLATLLLAGGLVVLLALAMRWNLGHGFERYTAAAELARMDWLVRAIETEYAARGSWDFLRTDTERQWRRLLRRDADAVEAPPRPPNRPEPMESSPGRVAPPEAANSRPAMAGEPGPPGAAAGERQAPRGLDERPPAFAAGERRPYGAGGDMAAPGGYSERQGPGGWRQNPSGGMADQRPPDSDVYARPPPGPWGAPPRPPRPPGGQDSARPEQMARLDSPQVAAAVPGDAPEFRPPPPERPPGGGDALRIAPRLGLLDTEGNYLAGHVEAAKAAAERPLRHQGKVVGRLTLQAAPTAISELDAAFLSSQTHNILLAGLAALALSLFAAWLLARHLLAPVLDLNDGARRIADGWLDARIPVRRDDELGELAYNFNLMAGRLAKIEESRRAWIADASHELRTPLAVLRAEIEAMQDGVRAIDAATLARLHKQVQQLATLVDDLRLTLEREPGKGDMEQVLFSPLAILDEVVLAFRERYAAANLSIETRIAGGTERKLRGDAGRLTQVFTNLLENSLRYTDGGGRLRISARAEARRLLLLFDDTAPAPSRAALPRLFERFFRAESSRSRALGGSGLGLAICKSLVEAHGGAISASLSELGGLSVRIELPLEK